MQVYIWRRPLGVTRRSWGNFLPLPSATFALGPAVAKVDFQRHDGHAFLGRGDHEKLVDFALVQQQFCGGESGSVIAKPTRLVYSGMWQLISHTSPFTSA